MEIFGSVTAIAAAAVALAALRSQRASHNLSALFEMVTREYLDRPFKSTLPPVRRGRTISNTRTLKARAYTFATKRPLIWSRAVEGKKWPNRLAYEVSIALERIGAAAFSGAIPLRLLLPLAADQIIDDWIYCLPWVKQYRAKPDIYSGTVPFHRRYAEWLALAAAVWMRGHYPDYKPLAKLEEMYHDPKALKRLLIARTSHEKGFLKMAGFDPVVREIDKFVGIGTYVGPFPEP